MSYTPINWQTGDTITAEKLNRCDNGWGVGSTELFSETVTTVDDGGFNVGTLTYSDFIDSDTLAVTFDGTDYVCNNLESPDAQFAAYGAPWSDALSAYDFSEYPFNFYLDEQGNSLVTETAGTHTITVISDGVVVSEDFSRAVNSCVTPTDTSTMPMRCISGITYRSEIENAIAAGKLVYFWTSSHGCFFITKVGRPFTIFPESSEVTATHNSTGLLNITES